MADDTADDRGQESKKKMQCSMVGSFPSQKVFLFHARSVNASSSMSSFLESCSQPARTDQNASLSITQVPYGRLCEEKCTHAIRWRPKRMIQRVPSEGTRRSKKRQSDLLLKYSCRSEEMPRSLDRVHLHPYPVVVSQTKSQICFKRAGRRVQVQFGRLTRRLVGVDSGLAEGREDVGVEAADDVT